MSGKCGFDTALIDIRDDLRRAESEADADEATRAVRSARNRIHIFRESLQTTHEDFTVVDSGVRQDDQPEADGLLPVGEMTLTVTVANSGDDAAVVPLVRFYDEEGDELESVRGPAFDLAGGTEGKIELDVEVPSDASRYAVSVVEDDESTAV